MRYDENGTPIMSLQEFAEEYNAIKRPNTEDDYFFNKYDDDDFSFVLEQLKKDKNSIWTLKTFNGRDELSQGFSRIDAMGYVIAETPQYTGGVVIITDKEEGEKSSMCYKGLEMDEFISEWEAIPNHIHPENGFLFKDTPEELEFVKSHDEMCIWECYENPDEDIWPDCEYVLWSGWKEDEVSGEFIGYFVTEFACNTNHQDDDGIVVEITK